jgi:hypothetical protein
MQMRSLLTGLLAAQVVLAGSLFVYNQNQRGGEPAAPLLAFPVADVDRIVVRDNDDATTLVRNGDAWQLPELSQLPANSSRVITLLDNLEKLKTQWPVASSAAGRERFEVTEDNFQRHLTLYQGETVLGEYYFGTSPGLRQAHARRAEDDDVYALAFNSSDLPADDNDWLQKDLLSIDGVTAIKGADFELVQQDDAWQLTPQPDVVETALDPDKAKAMISALQNLRVLRVAESVPAGETHALTVTTKDGSKDYLFTRSGSQHFIKRSDLEQSFTISSNDYDKLGGATRASLLQSLPEPAALAPPAAGNPGQTGSEPAPVDEDATP